MKKLTKQRKNLKIVKKHVEQRIFKNMPGSYDNYELHTRKKRNSYFTLLHYII